MFYQYLKIDEKEKKKGNQIKIYFIVFCTTNFKAQEREKDKIPKVDYLSSKIIRCISNIHTKPTYIRRVSIFIRDHYLNQLKS